MVQVTDDTRRTEVDETERPDTVERQATAAVAHGMATEGSSSRRGPQRSAGEDARVEDGGEGGTAGTAGSSAAHGAMVSGAAGSAAVNGAAEGDTTGRKRDRGVVSGELAVKKFVAFVAGVRVSRVVMVGGVHVLAGTKRTRDGEDESRGEVGRAERQRDERGARFERREQRRRIAEENGVGRDEGRESEASRLEGAGGPGDDGASEGSEEFGGAWSTGNWGAGGLGDRTGVG